MKKEEIHTIPISDAFAAEDECPFCFIERKAEERMMDFVLGAGASYMESDIRAQTDREGFCRAHYQKMFRYGNALGNAWILKTYYQKTIEGYNQVTKNFKPSSAKTGLFRKKQEGSGNQIAAWVEKQEETCYICDTLKDTFRSYMDTFFTVYRKDETFRQQVLSGKGFCLTHFAALLNGADEKLSEDALADFYEKILPLEKENLSRVYEDVAWFIEKYDYKNRDADWKNSKDAVQRGMQKIKGGYPADPPYEMKR